jgi:hypothetical protein
MAANKIRNAIAGSMLIANPRHAQPLHDQTHRELVYRPLQFHERCQDFIRVDDETLSVTMSVNNPDRARFQVDGRGFQPALRRLSAMVRESFTAPCQFVQLRGGCTNALP